MLVPMSTAQMSKGFCFQCGIDVEVDIVEHFAQEHQPVVAKPKTAIKSWQNRLDAVIEAMHEIRQESDRAVQVQKLDEDVIKELYLVRARLTQLKRTPTKKQERTEHGSS